MEHRLTLAPRLAKRSGRAQIAFSLGTLGIYGLIFTSTYYLMGPAATTLAVLPVATIGWRLGMRGGLLAALFCVLLNVILLNLVGESGWAVVTRTAGGSLGAIVLVLIGGVVGRTSDLGRRATQELVARKRAEEVLERLRRQNELILNSAGEGIYGLDLQGRTTFVNPAAAKMLGYEVEELMGQPMHDTLHHSKPDGRPYAGSECPIYAAFRDGATHRVTDEVFWKKDGTSFPVAYVSTPIRARDELVGAVVVFEDTTARDRAAAELVKLRLAVETSGEVIFLTDRDGLITYVNPEFTRLYGHTAEAVVGKVTPRILKSERMKPEDYEWFWQTILNKQVVKGEHVNKAKDGRLVTVEGSASPILDEHSNIIGFLAIQRDISERKQAEEALRESEANLNRAQAVAHTGSWRLDIRRNILSWSAEAYRIFGVPVGTPLTYQSFLAAVHPEDRERVDRSWQAAVAGAPYDIEHRIVVNDRVTWVSERVEFERDANGLVKVGIGTVQDITERKRVEEERARLLQETHQRAEELEALTRVSAALRRARTREEMLPVLAEKAAQVVGGIASVIYLVEPASGDLVARGWYTPGATPVIGDAAGIWRRHHLGEGITGHVAASGQIYVTQDLQHDPLAQVLPGEIDFLGAVRSQISLPLRAQEQIIGVMHVGLGEQHTFAADEVRLLTAIADMAANALHRATLHEQTERDAVELAAAYDATLEGWSRALELRDRETEGHTLRVTEMTLRLARAMGIGEPERVHIRRGTLLHDIGKMGVPDSILLKPGSLTEAEWEIMRRHPSLAYEMLLPLGYLRPALDIPYCHHEKWDGTGYPRGLKGEEIPLAARIFAIVDVWDALRSDRPYRKAWSEEKGRAYVCEQAGKHFDPQVVKAFLKMMTEANE